MPTLSMPASNDNNQQNTLTSQEKLTMIKKCNVRRRLSKLNYTKIITAPLLTMATPKMQTF